MKNRVVILVIIFHIFLFFSCHKKTGVEVTVAEPKPCDKKDQICSSGVHYLSNRTKQAIQYSWESSSLNRSLAPGQTHTMVISDDIKVTYSPPGCQKKTQSSSIYTLYTSIGILTVQMDHCAKKSVFRYDSNDSTSVDLYDESE